LPPLEQAGPQKIGGFAVQQVLVESAFSKVFLALDPVLRRPVFLWLRPIDTPALAPARRQLNRATRLRWLTSGQHEGWQWDAFMAANGGLLSAVVASQGHLPWSQTRTFLEGLTDELVAALA